MVIQWIVLRDVKASLYYLDAGTETKQTIDASNEPWKPLSRFIVTENPYVKHRTAGEILELKDTMERYRLEYTQSLYLTLCCLLGLIVD